MSNQGQREVCLSLSRSIGNGRTLRDEEQDSTNLGVRFRLRRQSANYLGQLGRQLVNGSHVAHHIDPLVCRSRHITWCQEALFWSVRSNIIRFT